MGFPILVKAVMGGGGKGMKLAMSAADLRVSTPPILNTHLCIELLLKMCLLALVMSPCALQFPRLFHSASAEH